MMAILTHFTILCALEVASSIGTCFTILPMIQCTSHCMKSWTKCRLSCILECTFSVSLIQKQCQGYVIELLMNMKDFSVVAYARRKRKIVHVEVSLTTIASKLVGIMSLFFGSFH